MSAGGLLWGVRIGPSAGPRCRGGRARCATGSRRTTDKRALEAKHGNFRDASEIATVRRYGPVGLPEAGLDHDRLAISVKRERNGEPSGLPLGSVGARSAGEFFDDDVLLALVDPEADERLFADAAS